MPHSPASQTATIDGHEIDVASLETINYGRLSAQEPAEVEKLLRACQMPGFFYLDFQHGPAEELITDVREIYAVSKQYFDQPQEVKMKDHRAEQDPSQDRGWVLNFNPLMTSLGQMDAKKKLAKATSHMEKQEDSRLDFIPGPFCHNLTII